MAIVDMFPYLVGAPQAFAATKILLSVNERLFRKKHVLQRMCGMVIRLPQRLAALPAAYQHLTGIPFHTVLPNMPFQFGIDNALPHQKINLYR